MVMTPPAGGVRPHPRARVTQDPAGSHRGLLLRPLRDFLVPGPTLHEASSSPGPWRLGAVSPPMTLTPPAIGWGPLF